MNNCINIYSVRNKVNYIAAMLSEFQLDLLHFIDECIFESHTAITEETVLKTHALFPVPRSAQVNGRGGVFEIYFLILSNTRLSPVDFILLSFEYIDVVINRKYSHAMCCGPSSWSPWYESISNG